MQKKYLVSAFLAIFIPCFGQQGFARSFSTPRDTALVLLEAAVNRDSSLWVSALSDADMEGLSYLRNTVQYRDTASEKFSTCGDNKCSVTDDEFVLSSDIVRLFDNDPEEAADREIFSHSFVKAEYIWNATYAEVLVVVQIDGKHGPMLLPLPMVKEHGAWKLAQWLALDMFLMPYATQNSESLSDFSLFVGKRLWTRAGLLVNLEDCSARVTHYFRIPPSVSAFFRKKWLAASGPQKDGMLEAWLLTGDPAAVDIAQGHGINVRRYLSDGGMDDDLHLSCPRPSGRWIGK